MPVKDNLLVIRMNVAGLTQWESSWPGKGFVGGLDSKELWNLWKAWDAGRVPGDQSVLQAGISKAFHSHVSLVKSAK